MSHIPPNPYTASGPPQMNANAVPQYSHSQPFSQVPVSQLPPSFGGLKQDANSNNPLPPSSAAQNIAVTQVNNYSQSASSSPAFNQQGMFPQPHLSTKPEASTGFALTSQAQFPTLSAASPRSVSSNPSPSIFPPNIQQQQINNNAPPLIPSSHHQPLVNGPTTQGHPIPGPALPPQSVPGHTSQPSQYPNPSSAFAPAPRPVNTAAAPVGQVFRPTQVAPMTSQPNMPFSVPPTSAPAFMGPSVSSSRTPSNNSQPPGPMSGPSLGPPLSNIPQFPSMHSSTGLPPTAAFGPQRTPMNLNGPNNLSGPPMSGLTISGPPSSGHQIPGPPISGQPISRQPTSGPPMSVPPISGLPISGPLTSGPPISRPPMPGPQNFVPPMPGPPISGTLTGQKMTGPPSIRPTMGPPTGPTGPMPPQRPPTQYPGPQNGPSGALPPPMGPPGPQNGPPTGLLGPPGPQMGQAQIPQMGPPKTNMQGRYPPMPQGNYINQQPASKAYGTQQMTNQMANLSVTKQGFDQLWGHQMFDLLSCRQILPEYPEEPPEIRLGHQFADAPNCSPEIFRSTVNRIPETNSLLQRSRLPLGILIHPFKDLHHLPVIQCNSIVRCRACRTYINPFVYFVDSKRWKCNLCYRVNDLPEEFQYDPVSKSYGDPSRRPEIKSATIEFIAPGEYMLRPPQPAVYLFLCDVSQAARDSGYLQIFCDTLKANLDQLPGDARTQVGFICYDAHIHYYLMSDGLTRPKEMTVLDIDDVFLPSPESLLVNLGERRELVKELLSVLPKRHSGPGVPSSALGAALQAAYKLMAPTGGRITVFQTCLPNVGPGALQPREDPNARSSADVQHLNPSTDFYKRIALDCSGAQVAVDLFLLNAMYCDLATLSGMSKFSAGSVQHIPLFNAARVHQAAQLTRRLVRYLTRKIGFEAVMRVRCTRGISIHTFHGNFFVRSTDLLSLPNVSPDAGFGMQLAIEESLSDLQHVCFQAALLYTSSKGERRIRVHTLALPIASSLTDVLHSADTPAIIGLLAKMAVDRCSTASLSEAREALINVAIDALCAHRLAQNLPAGAASSTLHAPSSLRLLPLYLLALLKRKAFRVGTSTRLDDRVMDMCEMKTLPLPQLMRAVYPDLYPIHELRDYLRGEDEDDGDVPDPPRLHLSAERINSTGAYLLDDGETMVVYIGHLASPAFLSDTFGVTAFNQLPDEARSLPRIQSSGNALLHAFVDKLNDDRPYASNMLVLRDNSPNRQIFIERLVDDRIEGSFSYYEFLQHLKVQVK